ncbi:substrate-binding domain-containing protein [Massilia sp. TWR1-2-2]|uniref:substrate-binding domain-containing protein n=1 Tax=Massilia sp. TWR1-2-2 TaxID=2804584 RepID=UPI003CF69FDB
MLNSPNCLAVIGLLALALANPARAETIKVGGTGAALGTLHRLGDAFERLHPEHRIVEVPSLGSSGGLKALAVGAIALAVSGRELTAQETQAGLQSVRYGSTPFAFAAHPGTPDIALSKARLADIYAGRQLTWPNGQPIRLVIRPRTEGDTALLRTISPAMDLAVDQALARRGMVVAVTDTDSADQLEKYPHSLGSTTLALVSSEQRQIKLLAIDGIAPSVEALVNGSYPYVKHLHVVVASNASPATRQFLQFMLSTQGRDILRALGHQTYWPREATAPP